EALGDRRAEAVGAAGHDGGPALQHHLVHRPVYLGARFSRNAARASAASSDDDSSKVWVCSHRYPSRTGISSAAVKAALARRTASGLLAAISAAISRAAASSSPRAVTRSMTPIRCSSAASIRRPVKNSSRDRDRL